MEIEGDFLNCNTLHKLDGTLGNDAIIIHSYLSNSGILIIDYHRLSRNTQY